KDLGNKDDPESAAYKANQLGKEAEQQRRESATWSSFNKKRTIQPDPIDSVVPPPEVETLQHVNEAHKGMANSISDDPVNKEVALDMRRDAQKEAALSYGARGGL